MMTARFAGTAIVLGLSFALVGCPEDPTEADLAVEDTAENNEDASGRVGDAGGADDTGCEDCDADEPDTSAEDDAGSDEDTDGSDAQDATDADVDTSDVSEDVGPEDTGSEDTGPQEICPPGLTGCLEGVLFVCSEDGTTFEETACDEGLVCSDGACVECAADGDCESPAECVAGSCEVPELVVLTDALPSALLGVPYLTQIVAQGGAPPYEWSPVDVETWPIGVSVGVDGQFGGVPQETGTWDLEFRVTDSQDNTTTRVLQYEVSDVSVAITTPSPLPPALEGEPYSVTFEADGGTQPYFFGALDTLPEGLSLGPGGVLAGTPVASGDYAFDIKVFDNGAPTLSAQKTFELSVDVAPLDIIGENPVNLIVAELFTLPLIVIVEGLPVPYNASLQAKGGKKPYVWTEEPLPGFVQNIIPNSGIPDGLTLNPDGTITGGVSDPSLVVNVAIPFTDINLSGFFFAARVTDAQDPAESESALYIIPTVPLGN